MNKTQKKIAVGAGITALAAAAAAGTYFFAGKRGKENRAKVSKWADTAKKDVVKQLKGMKDVTKSSYNSAVDAVVAQYTKAKKVNPKELIALASELKGHWDNIAGEVSKVAKKVAPKKAAKAAPKQAAKKSPAKKTAKK